MEVPGRAEKTASDGLAAPRRLYSSAYAIAGWALLDQPTALSWFRAVALLVPPMTGTIVIVRRRHSWAGCQWLFWATIALGLAMSAIG